MRSLALLAALAVAPVASAQFAVQVPAPSDSRGWGLAETASGFVLVGEATGDFDADPGPGTAPVSTSQSGIAMAFAPDGAFRWVWTVPTDALQGERSVLRDAAPRLGGGVVAVGQLNGTVDLGATGTVSARDGLLVVALDPDGAPVWAFATGGPSDPDVLPEAVATDAAGNAYVAGTYSGRPDLDPGPGEAVLPFADRRAAFVASYSATGGFRWAFNVGAGTGNVRAEGVAVGVGGVFVTGSFLGTYDFDPGPGEVRLTSDGGSGTDGFAARYTTDGALGWASRFGRRSRSDYGFAVAPDGDGGAFVGGSHAIVEGSQTWGQAYVARFDGAGAPVWDLAWGAARPNGEVNRDEVHAVAYDGSDVTVGGWFYAAADVDPGPGTAVLTPDGFRQAFVARYRAADGAFVEALDVGGSDATDDVAEIALGGGLVTAAGTFDGTETFPDGTALTSASSSGNAFLTRFGLGVAPPPPPPLTLLVQETVAVSNADRLRESLQLLVAERVGVTDRVRFLEALALAIQERIAVTDDPQLLGALRLFLQETVAALDGLGLAQADGSEAVSAFGVRADGRVSFVGPVGLDVVLTGVRSPGTLAVRFESRLAPTGRRTSRAPFTWTLRADGGLDAATATARFDLAALGEFRQPETVVVEWRADPADPFAPLATTWDAAAGEAVAVLPALGGQLSLVGEGVPVDAEGEPPAVLALGPPAPNPSAGAVRVVVDLPEPGDVRLEAFDVRGRRVAVLLDGPMAAGSHAVELRAGAFAPGVYVLRLTADAGTAQRSLTVAR